MRSPAAGVAVLALLTAAPARSADPPAPSPEQKVLDRYSGSWTTTYKVLKAEWTPEDMAGSAAVTFERVLGGTYLQEKSDHADKSTGMAMRTYDARRKTYRAWWFSSAGHSTESVGTWNEATKTFTWVATAPDRTTTSRRRFTDDDTFEWDVLVTGKAGGVLYRVDGTSVRAKGGKK